MADPSEVERDSRGAAEAEPDEEYAPTPFDNPFFLPVVLLAFCVWFVYDGWFNPDMEYIMFNRVGAGITLALGLYFLWRAIQERAES